MTQEIKKLPHSRVEFEIDVPRNEWEKYLDQAAAEASQEFKIAGFRPGKAPRNLVEQKVGKAALLNSAAHKAIEKSYIDFVREKKLEVLGPPKVEILEIEEGKDLKFKCVAEVMPEIKLDEKYKKDIKKINEEFAGKKIEIKDDQVDLEIERLANTRVKLVTVRREAQKNDSVEIDFQVSFGGVPIENGTSKNHPLTIGKGVFIPGFEENIIGMKEGEEKSFELTFPEKYHDKNLAGKPATFNVKMDLVQERQTPEVNDEFAKSLGNFADLAALKKNIGEGLEHEETHKNEDEKRGQYVEILIKNSQVDLPEILVKKEQEKMMSELEYQTQAMGMNLVDYLEKIGKKKEDLEKDQRPQAEKRVISALAMEEIVRLEEIKVESAEVEAEMNKTIQYYKNSKDIAKNIDMEKLYNYSKSVLENEKVFEFLEKL